MDIERAIADFGSEAVVRYRAMAETRHDNEVSGSVLRSHVASRLHDRLKCAVHVDRLYTALAIDMGVPITPDLVTFLGAHRAHVALCGNMFVGERQASRDRQWEWCFACASVRQ